MAKRLQTRKIVLPALVLTLAPLLGAAAAWAARGQEPQGIEGRIFAEGLNEKQRAERAVPRRLDPAATITHEMRLEPFVEPRDLTKSAPDKGFGAPLEIGRHRRLPAALEREMAGPDLTWEPARGGGQVAVFSITSPAAKAIRLALDIGRLPSGSELRFYSPAAPAAEGGVFEAEFLQAEHGAGGEPFWSPVVHGETVVVEIWVADWRRASEVRLSVRQVSHIYRSLEGKDLRDIGFSGGCNRDIECFNKFTTAADAVAKIIFDIGGGSALCTGQLVNNAKGKLLFLTAAHCISSRSEASSTTFFWFFERASCNGPNPTSVVQTGGGGKLLFTSRSFSDGLVTDHTLMRLRRQPPPGTALLGWEVGADPADNLREKIHGIHHPAGDVKKGSRGKVTDTWQLSSDGSLNAASPATHYEVVWKKGTTEGGSSGSAILTGKRWPDQFLIGVLTGGFASCSARRDPDFYGAFEETFRRFKKFRKHFE